MASLTGQLVAETYKALLKTIDNDILTASEKQITDGFGGGSNVFIDSQGFLRANKYKVTNGLATQFLKADGSLDANTYLTGITSSQIITALGYTPVTNARTLTINGTTYDLSANRSWTIAGTAAVWGNISGTLSNQTDLQNALNAKYNNPTGTISQYIRGDGSLATFPTFPGGLPTGGTSGQILAKIDATDYNTEWIDNYATQTKNEVKLGAALSKGTPVYVSSANGTNMIVSAASNTSEATSSKTFGLLETGGVLNDLVKCVTFGLLAGLDTSTAQAGDAVWLGPNGTLLYGLANKPVAPAHMVYIGVVTRVQSNNGEIFVNVQNGFEIEELHDVLIQSKANNQGLFYESSTGLWKNKSIATVLGYTPQAQLNGTGFVKASGTTISYDNSTYLTTAAAALAYQPLDADLTAIATLAGTSGFLKKSAADTWVLDTNTYLTTASAASTYLTQTTAASTYQRLDKMVSNLLASDTEYPNSNAVLAKLALKADAANPVFTGNMTISGAEPKLYFVDTDQNPDYTVLVDAGYFKIYDQTAGATRFQINSDGNISTGTGKSITAGSFIKDGGTASQFLKADGSIDSSTYVTSATLANYLLSATAATTYQTLANLSTDLTASATKYPSVNAVVSGLDLKQPLDGDLTAIAALTGTSGFLKKTAANTWSLDTSTYLTTADASTTYLAITTAASTYQRLDKMVSNLLASSTEYPNSNAVIAALALKADAANPVFTGNMTISGISPKLYFTDTDNNPDYTLFVDSGYFYIYDQTAGATKFQITPSGNAINTGTLTSASFIKSGGTSSQFLMADGSVSTFSGVTGSGTTNYIPKFTSGSGIGNSIMQEDSNKIGITSGGLGWIYGNDFNHSIILRGDRNGTAANYTNYYQYGGLAGDGYGHKFWTGGVLASQTLKMQIADDVVYIANNTLIGTSTNAGYKLDVNGTGRFSGALGVGAGASNATFQVNGDWVSGYSTVRIQGATNSQAGLGLYDTAGARKFVFASTGSLGYIETATGVPIEFQPGGSPKIRISSSGVLGVGDLDPTNTYLSIKGDWPSGYATVKIAPSTSFASGGSAGLGLFDSNGSTRFAYFSANNNQAELWVGANKPLLFGTADTERMRITSGGVALIGTTSTVDSLTKMRLNYSADSCYFDITSGADAVLRLGGTYGQITNTTGALYISNAGATGDMIFRTGSTTERMRITANGEVGIGVTPTSGNRFWVRGNDSTANNTSLITQNSNGTITFLVRNDGLSYFQGGNVLIGTTTDSGYKLDVNGFVRFTPSAATSVPTLMLSQGGAYGNIAAAGDMYHGLIMRGIPAAAGDYSVTAGDQMSFYEYGGIFNFYKKQPGVLTRQAYIDNGNYYGSAYFETSDIRLKTLIDESAQIAGIENLEAKLYEKDGKIELGYFAQDAELIMPNAVIKNLDGFLSLSYREVHTAKIARLEKRVAELEKQLNLN